MLRVNIAYGDRQVTLKLEGKLSGPWVREVERCWLTLGDTARDRSVQIDLTDVSFVDAEGRALIEAMAKANVGLIAAGPMIKAIVEDVLGHIRRPRSGPGKGGQAA